MTRVLNEKGYHAEAFIEFIYGLKGFPFRKATYNENLYDGIDGFMGTDLDPTDIKNTDKIFFAKYDLVTNKFSIRHPFRKASKATHYCFVDVNINKDVYIYKEHTLIKTVLLRDWFKDEASLSLFYHILSEYDKKNYSFGGKASSLSQSLFTLKKEIMPLLNKTSKVVYSNIDYSKNSYDQSISFWLEHFEEQIIRSSSSSSIKTMLKNSKILKTTPELQSGKKTIQI